MNNIYKATISCVVLCITLLSCNGDKDTKGTESQTLLSGETVVLVDNTVQPVIEDVLAVFHSVYDRANVKQVNMSETQLINTLLKDSASVVVLPRLLTDAENAHFKKRKITPQITPFASDAVALITHPSANDTVVDLEEVLKVLRGQTSSRVSKLVFDNANSSTVQYLLRLAGVKSVPSKNIYSLNTNEEVIKYVHTTPGAIGIVGVNWLTQPPQSVAEIVSEITVLGVNNVKVDKGAKKYYKPSQSNIATGFYPMIRKVYVLNYSAVDGLGMGFATYIGAFEGQRIILKSGLLPVDIPAREIEVRSDL